MVVIIRPVGQHMVEEMMEVWSIDCASIPTRKNFSCIFNARKWVGIVMDTEIFQQIAHHDEFRRQYRLGPGTRPQFVYLNSQNVGSEFLTKQIQTVRGTPELLAYTANEVWQKIVLDKAMPKEARSFLK